MVFDFEILLRKLFVLTIFLSLSSCFDFCKERFYVLEIPISVTPQKSQFRIGDTVFIQMIIDRSMVYDTFNDNHLNIPEFNPHLQIHNVVIDTYPTMDDLDTMNFECHDVNCSFEYIYYSLRSSYGVRIDEPSINGDSIIVNCRIILSKLGTHVLYFHSPISFLDNIIFEGKCRDSYIEPFMHLLHDNNENVLTQNNRDVLDKHFEKSDAVNQLSTKYYFNVTE